MAYWVESGHLVEAILGLTVFEWLALAAYHRHTGRGVAPQHFSRNLLSGMFLLLALRQALTGAWWGWIAACLLASLLAHLADLARRWVA
jgi:hypothetical protein